MTHAARGRSLELAIKRAAQWYRKQDRACLVQQYPRTATRDGHVMIVGTAPADFIGAIGEAAAVVEAKSCERKSFPLSNIDAGQRAALDAFEEYGFDVRLVIEMCAYQEVYVVPWCAVAAFILAPTRKSLSITWLRAYGQLAPVEGDAVMFLDGVAHPDSERCMLAVWYDRQGKPLVSADGDQEEEEDPRELERSPYAGLTPEQVRSRLLEAVGVGLERQKRAVRRTWGGTRRRVKP